MFHSFRGKLIPFSTRLLWNGSVVEYHDFMTHLPPHRVKIDDNDEDIALNVFREVLFEWQAINSFATS